MNKARKPGAADRERIVKDEKCCRRNCKAARHLAFGSLAHEQALHLGESRDFTQEQHAKGDAFARRLLDASDSFPGQSEAGNSNASETGLVTGSAQKLYHSSRKLC